MGASAAEEPSQMRRALVDTLAGAISGGISRTVTSPLDVIKIRFQVQLEPTTSWGLLRKDVYGPSKYTGLLQATKDILREEGLPGFWRGNVPALFMYMPYTAIQFTVLHKLKTFASGSSRTEDHLHLSPYLSYVSGAIAGCAATVGSYPFDLLRTILASQGEPKVYPNMRSALFDIIQTRGVRGLYAGLSPTLVEIIPYAGLQFGSYDTFKRSMMSWNRYRHGTEEDDSASSFQLFLCGFAAGTFSKAACHPLDVVKKRFQAIIVNSENLDTTLIGNRSFCRHHVGNGEGALNDANFCRSMRPDSAHSCWLQGYSYVQVQEYEKACDAFLDGLKLNPGFTGIEKALRAT